ncbi:lipopolysaccharide biosynthesis protein [Micromonospora siamensis]|uniref:Membrane protein involved in the export of O-antigen and teichoic acid n=1 Tax=Micromonospora siamensis TaxID=299152 RepID=A0A1C5HZL9_9ACTN|nr:oligosaccharide flippase family protein [Micromonospora siamensis]SCG51407.1 Membrane protein involved in the export of O-antigen and teichoic acid [Micromonospora siamensis]
MRALQNLLPIAAGERRVLVNVLTAVAGKGIGFLAPLIITPVAFTYMGAERYGLWMAVTALTGMGVFADLGLSDGLLTRLSYHARTDQEKAREIASAYTVLGASALVLLAIVALASRTVPWAELLGVDDPRLAGQVPMLVLICFGLLAANVPLTIIHRIQYAQGKAALSNGWQALSAVVSGLAVLAGVAMDLGYVVVVAVAVAAIPLMNLINTFLYFAVWNRPLRPRLANADRNAARRLLRLGLKFCLLSLLWSIALNVDSPLIARTLGLAAAGAYVVVAKLFALLNVFVTVMNLAIWPAVGGALARGDVARVRRGIRHMILLYTFGVGGAGLLLVVFGRDLLRVWVSAVDDSSVPLPLLGGLALWAVVSAMVTPLFVVQTATGMMKHQIRGWAGFLVLSIVLKYLLLRHIGVVGIPAGACLAYLVVMWPSAVVGYAQAVRSVQGERVGPHGTVAGAERLSV